MKKLAHMWIMCTVFQTKLLGMWRAVFGDNINSGEPTKEVRPHGMQSQCVIGIYISNKSKNVPGKCSLHVAKPTKNKN